jgi:hypothetical protein
MGEAFFRYRPFKPLVERSSRSTLTSFGAGTLTNPHMWGFWFNNAVYA